MCDSYNIGDIFTQVFSLYHNLKTKFTMSIQKKFEKKYSCYALIIDLLNEEAIENAIWWPSRGAKSTLICDSMNSALVTVNCGRMITYQKVYAERTRCLVHRH